MVILTTQPLCSRFKRPGILVKKSSGNTYECFPTVQTSTKTVDKVHAICCQCLTHAAEEAGEQQKIQMQQQCRFCSQNICISRALR